MLDLAPETEALARDIARARRVSVDEAVRDALRTSSSHPPTSLSTEMPAQTVARRRALLNEIVAEMATLPDLDHRSAKEITDDLNPL